MWYKYPTRPTDPVIPENVPGGLTRYLLNDFSGAGVDNWTQPPAQDQALFTKLTNILPVLAGTLQRRWGYQLVTNIGVTWNLLTEYQNDAAAARKIIASSPTAVVAYNEDGTTYNNDILTPSPGALTVHPVTSRSYAYFADGVSADLKKWDGSSPSGATKWGVSAPNTAVAIGAPSSGNITIASGRNYFVVFGNTNSGNYSDLNPVSASTGRLTAQNVPLSSIPTSTDPQVNQRLLLATADGGDQTTLYLLHVFNNNTTTTYIDSTTEITLLQQNVYQETADDGTEIGVADNTPPPNGTLPIKHRGRLFLQAGQLLYFSKSISELTTSSGTIVGRYEECWPAVNFFDTSIHAETVRSLSSDGSVLYIGTERAVYRLLGDSPNNFSLSDSFNDVGVLNHEVWRTLFTEGQPIGAMWLTPDFRVIFTDGNTYHDVGTPIQTTLNTINQSVSQSVCRATSVSSGAYDLFVLAIPTGSNTFNDTLCIYDLRVKRWYIWTLSASDTVSAILFEVTYAGVPQLIFSTNNGPLYKFVTNSTQDRTTPATSPQVILADSGATKWAVSISDAGIISTATTGSAAGTTFINDASIANTTWQLGVSTSGLLTLTSVAYNSTRPVAIWLLSVGGLVTALSVVNGALQTFTPVSTSPLAVTSTIQTSWLHLGEPTQSKILNELEVSTADTALTTTIDGATRTSDFTSPSNVITNGALVAAPLGGLKLYLAGYPTKSRYFRLTFTSASSDREVLDGLNLEFYAETSI